MTGHAAQLNAEFIQARRIELNILVRTVADALGMSDSGWRYVEAGVNRDGLTLAQLGVLAELLAVPLTDLLASADSSQQAPTPSPAADVDSLERRLGTLLFVAGHAVPTGVLADVLHVTTDQILTALDALRERLAPAGLVVSQRKHADATLVPEPGSLRDSAVRDLLRRGEQRGSLPSTAARTLQLLARGQTLPPRPTKDEQLQLASLLRAGWAQTGAKRRSGPQGVELHPDVRFSLALDEGYDCQPATATVHSIANRKRLPHLVEDPDEVTR
ncbi:MULTISPECIES: helix-turn-helix domain-containing protein [unclassified Modestobacter]